MGPTPALLPRLTICLLALAAVGCVQAAPTPTPTPRPTPAPTPTPSVPSAPVVLDAYAGNGSATLEWATPGDGGRMLLYYVVAVEPSGRRVQVPGATTHSWTVTGLSNGTPYTLTVAAANALGEGPFSAPSPPVVPAPLRPVSERSGTLQLGPVGGACINHEMIEMRLQDRDVVKANIVAADDVQVSFHTPHGDLVPIGPPRTAVDFERVAMIDGLHTLFVEARWRPDPALPCERQMAYIEYYLQVWRHAPPS